MPYNPPQPPDAALPLDPRVLSDWIGDEPELVRQVLADFLEINGGILGKLQQAVADGDPEATRMLAHRLKGSAGMVGAAPLIEVTLALEQSSGGAGASARLEAVLVAYRALEDHLREHYGVSPEGI